MKCVGVDPGINGGITFIDVSDGEVSPYEIPKIKNAKTGKNEYDIPVIVDLFRNRKVEFGMIELVHAMPRQGVSSTFFFGRGYGLMIGIMSAFDIPLTYVTPQKWKRHYDLGAAKEDARSMATKLAPSCAGRWKRKKDDGVAESFLIAHYGLAIKNIGVPDYTLGN